MNTPSHPTDPRTTLDWLVIAPVTLVGGWFIFLALDVMVRGIGPLA